MDPKEYWRSLTATERESLASACDTTVGHLRNVVYGVKSCAESLAINLERESGGKVRCESLRSDVDWAYLRGTSSSPDEETTRRVG